MPLDMKIKVTQHALNGPDFSNPEKLTFIIVDDEYFIRNAVKRVITKQARLLKKNLVLSLIEASDGIECLSAIYSACKLQIKIDAIICDENMPFFSGSFTSKILQELLDLGKIPDIKMYISSAVTHTNIQALYSKIVKKIYSKPLDGKSVSEIIDKCLSEKVHSQV